MLQGAPGTTARRPGSPRHSYSASSCLGARAGPPHRALGCVLLSRPHTLLLSPLAAACRQAAAAAACLSAPRPPSAPACDAAEARPGCTAAATVCEATSAHSRYLPHSLSTRLAGIPLTGSRGDKHGGSQGPWGRPCRRAYYRASAAVLIRTLAAARAHPACLSGSQGPWAGRASPAEALPGDSTQSRPGRIAGCGTVTWAGRADPPRSRCYPATGPGLRLARVGRLPVVITD